MPGVYSGIMRRKFWPWTMKTVFIVNAVLVGVQVIPAFLCIGLFTIDAIHPQNPPGTDSYMGMALLVGIVLLCLAAVLAGVTALLFIRKPFSRIMYTILIGCGIAASVTMRAMSILTFPAVILTATVVLTWLPASRPYFSNLPSITYFKNPASLR